MKKKLTVMITALAMVLCFAIGGTLAWLVDETDPVVNTFTVGDINITLGETTTDYKMIPGNDIDKNPKVTVEVGSEACWLFVKIEKSTNYDDYLADYEIADGWTSLAGENCVYYCEVGALTGDDAKAAEFPVLKDNKVTVLESVTKLMMEGIKKGTVSEPTLTFTAYAVQKDNLTVEQAWLAISSPQDGSINDNNQT